MTESKEKSAGDYDDSPEAFEKLMEQNQGALFFKDENSDTEWKRSIAGYFWGAGARWQHAKDAEEISRLTEDCLRLSGEWLKSDLERDQLRESNRMLQAALDAVNEDGDIHADDFNEALSKASKP